MILFEEAIVVVVVVVIVLVLVVLVVIVLSVVGLVGGIFKFIFMSSPTAVWTLRSRCVVVELGF